MNGFQLGKKSSGKEASNVNVSTKKLKPTNILFHRYYVRLLLMRLRLSIQCGLDRIECFKRDNICQCWQYEYQLTRISLLDRR